MRTLKKKIPRVIIEDLRDAWSSCPVHLEDFDSEVRKRFKGQWRKLLNKWILIEDGNGRLTYEVRLVKGNDKKLYPQVKGEKYLVNFHAGILFTALKDLIQTSRG